MKGIKRIVLASLFTISLASQADDKVKVVTTQGTTTYAMDKLTRIDVGSDALNVVATNGSGTTYAFDDVQKIVIALEATAVNPTSEAAATPLTLTVSPDGTLMTFGGWNVNEQVSLAIYDAEGRVVMQQASWCGDAVDISQLAHSVYVVKVGTHTAKFRK